MKTARKFKASWYFGSMLLAIIVGELAANAASAAYGVNLSPVTVAFVCVGLVAACAAVLYKDTVVH